jgi:glyoxylase-like metal-dependent hydrolase (beta-lactamase superfamily II)
MQILTNLYQLSGYDFGTVTSLYAVRGKDSIAIVEGGDENDWRVAKETLRYWSLGALPISHVFITHSHQGHSQNAIMFRKMGAKIVAVRGDADAIEQGDDRINDYGPFYIEQPFVPCPIDIRPKDGDIVNASGYEFQVIHLPGHTDGSHFLRLMIDGKIVLFTGDIERAYYHDDFRAARSSWSGGSDYNRATLMESTKKMSHLEADVLLPSHGQKTMVDGWKILKGLYVRALVDWRGPAIVDPGFPVD